ncbi:MAG: hypothetical protein ACFFDP_12700, partial [Promethearchaeota archaeon]
MFEDILNLVSFSVDCTPATWKQVYWINVKVKNESDAQILIALSCVETDEQGNQSNVGITQPTGLLGPGTWEFPSEALQKAWLWWTEPGGDMIIPVGSPLGATYKYKVSFTVKKIKLPDGTVEEVIKTYPPKTLSQLIVVPSQKLAWADEAHCNHLLALEVIALVAAWNGAGIASCGAPCFAIGWLYAPLVPFFFAQRDTFKFNAKTFCPIEFDRRYKVAHDYRRVVKKFKIEEEAPREVRSFIDSSSRVIALSKSVLISHARYLSAFRERDNKAARTQKRHAEGMLSQIEDELISLRTHLSKLRQFEEKTKREIDKGSVRKALKKLR